MRHDPIGNPVEFILGIFGAVIGGLVSAFVIGLWLTKRWQKKGYPLFPPLAKRTRELIIVSCCTIVIVGVIIGFIVNAVPH